MWNGHQQTIAILDIGVFQIDIELLDVEVPDLENIVVMFAVSCQFEASRISCSIRTRVCKFKLFLHSLFVNLIDFVLEVTSDAHFKDRFFECLTKWSHPVDLEVVALVLMIWIDFGSRQDLMLGRHFGLHGRVVIAVGHRVHRLVRHRLRIRLYRVM